MTDINFPTFEEMLLMNNHITIQFHGMEKKDRPSQLEDYLESLLRHAPSTSTCHLHIFKELQGYLCKLTVHSNVKTFSFHCKDENIKSALKTVLRNVKEQIAYWKKKRSSMELTGVTSLTGLQLKELEEEDDDDNEEELYHKKAS